MQQIQSTISQKYQTVVPAQVRKLLNLKAGDRLIWRLVQTPDKPKILTEPVPKNWAKYTRGLGKDIWQNINIDRYIQSLRQEWVKQK